MYVLRISTAGIHEYYLYHSDKAELDKIFLALYANYPKYRIEFVKINASEWKVYKKYLRLDTKPAA